MIPRLKRVGGRLYRFAEFLLVVMIAVMFAAFVIQVVSRYVFGWPTGSASELSVVCWLWLVLFGAAFVVREEEEIRFELLYAAVGKPARRAMMFVAAVALVALYGWSLPAVVDYVTFMRVEHTAYLKIRFDWLYSIYVIFAVAAIARYLWLGWSALTDSNSAEYDPTKAASGV
jgi:C4-dicarboxylate transporter DctQ subunit